MARTKKAKSKSKKGAKKSRPTSKPRFPYCTTPGALRAFLKEVPKRPKPAKVNNDLLKSWGIGDSNANTIIRVLKALDLVSSSNLPTDHYVGFMHAAEGPSRLAKKIQEVYSPLFQTAHNPHNEDTEVLRNLFNIHSGGSEGTITHQIQTFKALCDYADFDSDPLVHTPPTPEMQPTATQKHSASAESPTVHIDLHIHLPPDKSSREYEYIIQDIARHLLGRPGKDDHR